MASETSKYNYNRRKFIGRATITTARAGASTRLFEIHGCHGGTWTSSLLTWIFDIDKPGIAKKIRDKLDERGVRRGTDKDNFVYEPDEMKLLLEDMFVEAAVFQTK